jgi:hypothetical protein
VPGHHSLGGARLVRPSRPQSHLLAYKDLTGRRDTETRLCVKQFIHLSRFGPDNPP